MASPVVQSQAELEQKLSSCSKRQYGFGITLIVFAILLIVLGAYTFNLAKKKTCAPCTNEPLLQALGATPTPTPKPNNAADTAVAFILIFFGLLIGGVGGAFMVGSGASRLFG